MDANSSRRVGLSTVFWIAAGIVALSCSYDFDQFAGPAQGGGSGGVAGSEVTQGGSASGGGRQPTFGGTRARGAASGDAGSGVDPEAGAGGTTAGNGGVGQDGGEPGSGGTTGGAGVPATGGSAGGRCSMCADGEPCAKAGDCASGVCTASVCQVPTCSDSVQNGTETDIDCGGSCLPCGCPAGWAHGRKLLLNTTSSGANVSGTVQNFPVLIRLNQGNFDFTQAKAGGADIRFFDAGNESLPYQVDDWDAPRTKAAIWVQLPEVLGNNNQQFIMLCWGNPAATSESAGSAVFSPSNGFRGVWHLNSTSELQDSTGSAQPGIVGGTLANAAGTVAGGIDYDNNTADEVAVPYHSSQQILGGDYTVSAWVEPDEDWNSHSGRRTILSNQCGSQGYSLWADSVDGILWETRGDGAWRKAAGSTQAWIANAKYHVAVSQDETANTLRFYVNGVETTSMSYAYVTYVDSTGDLKLGHFQCNLNDSATLDGTLDEVRISNTRRSSDWIKLAYENQKTAQTLVEQAPD